jgi:hypothetical protein
VARELVMCCAGGFMPRLACIVTSRSRWPLTPFLSREQDYRVSHWLVISTYRSYL